MKRNLQHIDEIRFLIIHIILINHWSINLYLAEANYNHKVADLWFDLTSPALAMISGYLFFYKTKEHFNYLKKLKTRFHSLVVPYLFWTLTFFVVYAIVKDVYVRIFHQTYWYAPEQSLSFKNLLMNVVNPPLVNFWYLQNLVLILPFNFLIYYLLKNRYVFISIILVVIACYSFKGMPGLYFNSRFLPYYLLGCYFGYNELYIPKIQLSKALSLLLIPVLVTVAIYSSPWQDEIFPFLLIKIGIAFLFLITIFNMLDSNQNSYIFKYLEKYKPHSFFLFAINMFLFSFVQRTLLKLGAGRYLHYEFFLFLFLVVSLIAVLFLAFNIAGFLRKRFSKFYYTITGR